MIEEFLRTLHIAEIGAWHKTLFSRYLEYLKKNDPEQSFLAIIRTCITPLTQDLSSCERLIQVLNIQSAVVEQAIQLTQVNDLDVSQKANFLYNMHLNALIERFKTDYKDLLEFQQEIYEHETIRPLFPAEKNASHIRTYLDQWFSSFQETELRQFQAFRIDPLPLAELKALEARLTSDIEKVNQAIIALRENQATLLTQWQHRISFIDPDIDPTAETTPDFPAADQARIRELIRTGNLAGLQQYFETKYKNLPFGLRNKKTTFRNWFNQLFQEGLGIIHIACNFGMLHIVTYLLENGANPLQPDSNDYYPIYHALGLDLGATTTRLLDLLAAHAQLQHIDITNLLHRIYRRTPLHTAALFGNATGTLWLLNHAATINITEAPQSGGNTPLHNAAQGGHTEIIKILLEHGANPYMQQATTQRVGGTPFATALAAWQRTSLKLLLTKGAMLTEEESNVIDPKFVTLLQNIIKTSHLAPFFRQLSHPTSQTPPHATIAIQDGFALLAPNEADRDKVMQIYQKYAIPPGYVIDRIQVIYNPIARSIFEKNLVLLQGRSENHFFDPTWQYEEHATWKRKIMQTLATMTYTDPRYPAVKILHAWHGVKDWGNVVSICRTGYVNLATTDPGFYGKGTYSALEPEYAYLGYARENGYLILNRISFYSAYPVIATNGEQLKARGNYQNYDAHFIPVIQKGRDISQCYACDPNQDARFHEIVIFNESAQCIPEYLVTLKKLNPEPPISGTLAPAAVRSFEKPAELPEVRSFERPADLPTIRSFEKPIASFQQTVISALTQSLQDYNELVRIKTAKALVKLGQTNDDITATLTKAFLNQDSENRIKAVQVLVSLGQVNKHILHYLLETARTTDNYHIRAKIAQILGTLKITEPIIISLIAISQDVDSYVRTKTAKTLRSLVTTEKNILTLLLHIVTTSQELPLRLRALETLGRLRDPSIIATLMPTLQDEHNWIRIKTIEALGRLGQAEEPITTALLEALQNPSNLVSIKAAEALIRLGHVNETVITKLMQGLQHDDHTISMVAIAALGRLELPNEQIIAALQRSLEDPVTEVAATAAKALANLKQAASLIQALDNPKTEVRAIAALNLGRLTPSTEIIAALLKALGDRATEVRLYAIVAAKKLVLTDTNILATLLLLLQDDNESIRKAAASALGKLGQPHEPIITALLRTLQDQDAELRAKAASALSNILQPTSFFGNHLPTLSPDIMQNIFAQINLPRLPVKQQRQFFALSRVNKSWYSLFQSPQLIAQRTIRQHILPPGLQLQKIAGDGSCLYRAVTYYLTQGEDIDLLRAMVATNLAQHAEEYQDFIPLQEDQSLEDYIAEILDTHTWAGNVEINILMRLLKRPIVIIGPDGQVRNMEEVNRYKEQGEPIFVYYNGEDHYDALILSARYDARVLLTEITTEAPKLTS